MDSSPIVYITQDPPVHLRGGMPVRRDISSALNYGQIRVVLASDHIASLQPETASETIRQAMRNFNPDRDSICFAGGDPLSYAMTLVALKGLRHKRVTVLRWDRDKSPGGDRLVQGKYVPVTIDL